jgi:micrococcal nuclease
MTRYGRTLAYVDRADGWDYSIESARAGVVRDYVYENHPAQRYPQIAAAEQDAKQAGRGLWAHRALATPNRYRPKGAAACFQ